MKEWPAWAVEEYNRQIKESKRLWE